jgi:hypothetical protein
MASKKSMHVTPDEYLGIQVPATSGFRESRVAATLPGTPLVPADDDDLTAAEWDEVKRLALKRLTATVLDTPEGHLAYIRRCTAALTPGHV